MFFDLLDCFERIQLVTPKLESFSIIEYRARIQNFIRFVFRTSPQRSNKAT